MLAVGVERNATDKAAVRSERLDHLACFAVPDLDQPIPARRSKSLAVETERHAIKLGLVPDNDRLHAAQAHEIVPLPLAEFFWALAEELEGAAQVVCRQLAVGQSDAME